MKPITAEYLNKFDSANDYTGLHNYEYGFFYNIVFREKMIALRMTVSKGNRWTSHLIKLTKHQEQLIENSIQESIEALNRDMIYK